MRPVLRNKEVVQNGPSVEEIDDGTPLVLEHEPRGKGTSRKTGRRHRKPTPSRTGDAAKSSTKHMSGSCGGGERRREAANHRIEQQRPHRPRGETPLPDPSQDGEVACSKTMILMYTITSEPSMGLWAARATQTGKQSASRTTHNHTQQTIGKAAKMSNRVVV